MAGDAKTRWVEETLHPFMRTAYKASKTLFEDKSSEWHLELVENPFFGKILMLDGATQVTTRDEFIYHEMMAHVPILAHGNVKNALIIGGGDCGLAEEVLKHQGIESLTQVEIDAQVLEFSKAHFAEMNAPVFTDPRFNSVIADGAKFVAETKQRFDVIMVDSTDPIGPGAVLFAEEFYRHCHSILTPGGVLVTQNGVPFLQAQELQESITRFSRIFSSCGAYIAAIPTYVGGHMAMGFASDNDVLMRLSNDVIAERFAAANIETRYYTPAVHQGAFALPRFIEDVVTAGRKLA